MRKFIIPEELLTVLIQYLATKPFNEVFQIIKNLENLEITEFEKEK